MKKLSMKSNNLALPEVCQKLGSRQYINAVQFTAGYSPLMLILLIYIHHTIFYHDKMTLLCRKGTK